MNLEEVKSIIEALLFTWGDPLSSKEISNIMSIDKRKIDDIMEDMIKEFDDNQRGLRIVKMEDMYQIGTRPRHYDYIKKLNYSTRKRNLSNAALETLSIIAYKQPIIKSEIDHIRGVKCDRAIETLLSRNLIKEVGRLDKPGKPIIYATTEEFLKAFALETIDNLPNLELIKDRLKTIEE